MRKGASQGGTVDGRRGAQNSNTIGPPRRSGGVFSPCSAFRRAEEACRIQQERNVKPGVPVRVDEHLRRSPPPITIIVVLLWSIFAPQNRGRSAEPAVGTISAGGDLLRIWARRCANPLPAPCLTINSQSGRPVRGTRWAVCRQLHTGVISRHCGTASHTRPLGDPP